MLQELQKIIGTTFFPGAMMSSTFKIYKNYWKFIFKLHTLVQAVLMKTALQLCYIFMS